MMDIFWPVVIRLGGWSRSKTKECVKYLYLKTLRLTTWLQGRLKEKGQFAKEGTKTWEFYLLLVTAFGLILPLVSFPGAFALDIATPDQPDIEDVSFLVNAFGYEYLNVSIDCESNDVVAAGETVYICDFAVLNESGEELVEFKEQELRGEKSAAERFFSIVWWTTTKSGEQVRVRRSYINPFLYTHDVDGQDRVTVHGTLHVTSPTVAGVYDMIFVTGENVAVLSGNNVIVLAPSEANSLRIQKLLFPFQLVIVGGFILSVVKLWIKLFNRMSKKVDV